MKALVYRGPGQKAVEDRPKPEIEAPGENGARALPQGESGRGPQRIAEA
jgi:hypothetical protein